MNPFEICSKRREILNINGHLLIEGGPGSGKTTIALLKAKEIIDNGLLKPNQKILFLSFARATISRVEEQAKSLISNADKKNIEINTYHGFSWSIIQSFGYLLNSHRYFTLITPPNLSARLANIPELERDACKKSIFINEGIICFDLFSEISSMVLEGATKICTLISQAYPYILVDEFQDTDDFEWKLIRLLGKESKIIALADLNQRIYEFRGASITRIPEFNEHFKGKRIDLGIENHRSANTDIVQFGDDLLLAKNKGKQYKNVIINRYQYYQDVRLHLKYEVLNGIKRMKKSMASGKWSIAILVHSKLETLSVSSYLTNHNIIHEVLIDPAGPALSASIIAKMLEPQEDNEKDGRSLLTYIVNHIKGRKGEKVSKGDLTFANALEKFLVTGKVSGKTRVELIDEIKLLLKKRDLIQFSGIPENDWMAVRKLFEDSKHVSLRNVFEDAKYIRLLNKGAVLSEKLSEMWRQNQKYGNASKAIEDALTQEHFSMTSRVFNGIFVMNIHKSKGKEFDEVIIWEEVYKQIVRPDANPKRLQQDRLLLRVAITRAKERTTFLTPAWSPCILL